MSKKRYAWLFKIESSKTQINTYNVYRRNFYKQFVLIATVKVTPGQGYTLNPLAFIKPDEITYLSNHFKKIAGIKYKPVQTFTE